MANPGSLSPRADYRRLSIFDYSQLNTTCPLRQYAVYPPVVKENRQLGYVSDTSGINYSRDVGRSSCFGRNIFYQFGDTFCKDLQGNFIGVVSHTCAIVPDREIPNSSKYLCFDEDGKVKSFIAVNEKERKYDEDSSNGGRTVLWGFGGIVEDAPGSASGWTWFEKQEVFHGLPNTRYGTGVARVNMDPETGLISTCRYYPLLFGPDEPSYGQFSTLLEGCHIHLWGSKRGQQYLARVPSLSAEDKEAYEYWDGFGYARNPEQAVPVLEGMQHGAFFRSNMFDPILGIKYVFVGVNNQADNIIRMGCSRTLEGPYEMFAVGLAQGLDHPEGYQYCVYPHPWAFEEEKGELMVTWSEHWPGGVVAARLTFEQYDTQGYYHNFSINDHTIYEASQIISCPNLRHIEQETGATIRQQGLWTIPTTPVVRGLDLPRHLRIIGPTIESVEAAAYMLRYMIGFLVATNRAEIQAMTNRVIEERLRERRNSFSRRPANAVRHLLRRLSVGRTAEGSP